MRTLRSRAREMSGNRRQPSRRGQVGQGPARSSELVWPFLECSGRLCFRRWCLSGIPRRTFLPDPSLSGFFRHLGVFQSHCLSPLPQTREKEKMKEAKDARYTNGHLFTTISVSGMTMCYACNKSITAKEALICPSKLDLECHSDSDLPICPFLPWIHRGHSPLRASAGSKCQGQMLIPCSLSSCRRVVAGRMWHKQDYLGRWGRGD